MNIQTEVATELTMRQTHETNAHRSKVPTEYRQFALHYTVKASRKPQRLLLVNFVYYG